VAAEVDDEEEEEEEEEEEKVAVLAVAAVELAVAVMEAAAAAAAGTRGACACWTCCGGSTLECTTSRRSCGAIPAAYTSAGTPERHPEKKAAK